MRAETFLRVGLGPVARQFVHEGAIDRWFAYDIEIRINTRVFDSIFRYRLNSNDSRSVKRVSHSVLRRARHLASAVRYVRPGN